MHIKMKKLTVASYARRSSIMDKSTWQRTEVIILASELILRMSFSRSSRTTPESSEDTRSTLLRITISYRKRENRHLN